MNEATLEATGEKRGQLLGADFCDYFTDTEKARVGFQEVLQKGCVNDYPLTMHHKDGKLTDVLFNASLYKDINGKSLCVFAINRDVTPRKLRILRQAKELENLTELKRLKHLLAKQEIEITELKQEVIKGWSHALHLRDVETESHGKRVAVITVLLAKKLGIKGEALVHIARGALLHDIGKMGIPDSILLKPGSLSAEDWVIMKKHPILAYELLSPIHFLQEALEIPYCHHEKWDGTGYPRGLKGEAIPESARIFAVADVWDALRSDRPYRKKWDDEAAMKYILQQSGTHFDPRVVEGFAQMIGELN
jgi:putative nucleotidyltransferase with HDIG domain/PAS domain S-box-containing protein